VPCRKETTGDGFRYVFCEYHPFRCSSGMVMTNFWPKDYTLFDCKSPASHISELMRPGMHSYLVSSTQSRRWLGGLVVAN
jgi:hypothetical protein